MVPLGMPQYASPSPTAPPPPDVHRSKNSTIPLSMKLSITPCLYSKDRGVCVRERMRERERERETQTDKRQKVREVCVLRPALAFVAMLIQHVTMAGINTQPRALISDRAGRFLDHPSGNQYESIIGKHTQLAWCIGKCKD